jgi:hypothetical protein
MGVVLDAPWNGATFTPATPLDIATIETAILTQLKSQIASIEITHYPDRPETYRLTHRIGAALVRYDGAAYGPVNDTGAVVQRRRLRFAVRLVMRDLGWSFGGEADGPSPGAYAMIEAVRAALTGFQIGGCGKMAPSRERFIERDKQGAAWIYEISFTLTTAAVEASSTPAYPLFTRGVALESGGLSTTSAAAQPYTFNSSSQIALPAGNIIAATVTNPATGTAYLSGPDYTLDAVNGIITRASSGAIAAGATVNVAYSFAETAAVVASGGESPTAPTN